MENGCSYPGQLLQGSVVSEEGRIVKGDGQTEMKLRRLLGKQGTSLRSGISYWKIFSMSYHYQLPKVLVSSQTHSENCCPNLGWTSVEYRKWTGHLRNGQCSWDDSYSIYARPTKTKATAILNLPPSHQSTPAWSFVSWLLLEWLWASQVKFCSTLILSQRLQSLTHIVCSSCNSAPFPIPPTLIPDQVFCQPKSKRNDHQNFL